MSDKQALHPIVSPDGQWVACFMPDERDSKMKLTVIPLAGGEPLRLESAATTPDYGLIRWTPDSRALSYIVTRQDASNLWRSPLHGGAAEPLTNFTTEQIFRFAWSHDGKQLALERGQSLSNVILLHRTISE